MEQLFQRRCSEVDYMLQLTTHPTSSVSRTSTPSHRDDINCQQCCASLVQAATCPTLLWHIRLATVRRFGSISPTLGTTALPSLQRREQPQRDHVAATSAVRVPENGPGGCFAGLSHASRQYWHGGSLPFWPLPAGTHVRVPCSTIMASI